MKQLGIKKRTCPIKQRSPMVYDKKVQKITDWYNRLMSFRKEEVINPNNKLPVKRKELKSLEWYIDKIKKPMGDKK